MTHISAQNKMAFTYRSRKIASFQMLSPEFQRLVLGTMPLTGHLKQRKMSPS